MSVNERDPYTGHMTTGHAWNGIKELNTPVPKVVLFFLSVTFLFALGYWFLMPAWPLGDTYTRGYLAVDEREALAVQLATAREKQAGWIEQLEKASFSEIQTNDALMSVVNESGPVLYRENCAMCHGRSGQGGYLFPNLADSSWLWGGSADAIMKTLEVGINSDHPHTRIAIMPALGSSGVLDGDAVRGVVTYIRSLSNPTLVDGSRAADVVELVNGAKVYGTFCVACHGAQGRGNMLLGAPNLADSFWLYGNDEKSLTETIWNGRSGEMPSWASRLTLAQRKILTLYVLSLRAPDPM